ncbi:MAG: sigma-54-dependent Fis family transcriptional regulator [Oligoflexia bacterium]|nr:sigma-54-dependent Fis family transcriptional regulator [Oligoflexia bacterium]
MNMVKEELFGMDPKVTKAVFMAKNAANKMIPVLIMGEMGIGKQSLGILIHQESTRHDKLCMIVDCAKNEKLVEDEILGFRDEDSGRFNKGILERANGGTVILKNIDGLTENFQKKLHKIFLELTDYDIDVRILVTTAKNLSKLVGAGRFHRALYLYISEIQLMLPPLRERKDDIKFLTYRYLEECAREKMIEIPQITDEAMEKIVNYYWSHNVAELQAILIGSINNMKDSVLTSDDLIIGERKVIANGMDIDEDGIKLMSLKEAEKLLIKKALIHTSENRTQAARILGVSIRTLRNKINEYRNDGSNYFLNLR